MDIPNISSNMNVYDEADVDLSIYLTSQDGEVITVPGFYYKGYNFNEAGYNTGANGDNDFRVRFTVPKAGNWSFALTLKFNKETVETINGNLIVEEGTDDRGYIGVSNVNKQTFAFNNGEAYTAIGQNTAWSNVTGAENGTNITTRSVDMLRIMKASADKGANYTRFWLMPYWLSLFKDGYAPDNFNGGMGNAAEVDRIFDALGEMDMYASFTLFSYNIFRTGANDAWEINPFNSANNDGGYLDTPQEFFSNEQAKYDTKQYFRYLVARYGYSENILAWELFNESNIVDGYSSDETVANNVNNWHTEMTEYIKSIDAYGHLVTSSANEEASPINDIECLDFLSIHKYNYSNALNIENIQEKHFIKTNKPVMFGEIGINNFKNVPDITKHNSIDEELINVHLENWAGVFGGGAGTASNWYWMELDEIENGYDVFTGISKVSKLVPWQNTSLVDATATLSNENLKVMGYASSDGAYLWIYELACTHINHLNGTWTEKTFSDTTVSVDLENGNYTVSWYNTKTGDVISTADCTVSNGNATVTIPDFSRDIALIITK